MYKIRICNTKGTINTQYDQAHKMYINLDLTSPHIKSMYRPIGPNETNKDLNETHSFTDITVQLFRAADYTGALHAYMYTVTNNTAALTAEPAAETLLARNTT